MSHIWKEAVAVWLAGGWGMIPLAANSLVLAWIGLAVRFRLSSPDYRRLSADTSRRWIESASLRRGRLGDLLNQALAAASLGDLESCFEEFRQEVTAPFDRDLRIMQVCVSVSPLLGLLGTVTGMLTTFGALAVGSGGDQTMKMVAKGISEALITTETGLIIAIPGLLFLHYLQRQQERYRGFLAHVETLCAQDLHPRLAVAAGPTPVSTPAADAAGGWPDGVLPRDPAPQRREAWA